MQISYRLTADDYRDSLKVYRSQRFFGRWFWRVIWAPIVLAIVMPLVALIVGDRDAYLQLRPLALVGLLWAIILIGGPRRTASKLANGVPGGTEPRTMSITDEGIHTRNAQSESKLAWPSIVDWHDSKRVFTIFMTPISFFPIPKRAMTEAQQQEFRALLQKHVTDQLKNR